jgi:hypothetical protein
MSEKLNKNELNQLGILLNEDIKRKFNLLVQDPDFIYEVSDDIELFKKLSMIIINLKEKTNFAQEKRK